MRQRPFFVMFFLLLAGALFVGDGKSSYIDLVGAAVVIIVAALASLGATPRNVPIGVLTAWTSFLVFAGVTTAMSVDFGVSFSAIVRYIDAFVVYCLFYMYAPKDSSRVFSWFIMAFGVFSLVSALLFALFPFLRGVIPPMNLLWSGAGHNHITDVWLVVLFPALFVAYQRPKFRYAIVIMLISVFVWSQARAALAAAAIAIAWFVASARPLFSKKGLALALFIFVIATGILFFVPEFARKEGAGGLIVTPNKTALSQDRRLEYWRQASRAIRDRPIFGFGPGTFFLLSNRYQSSPENSSWFAHNYVLEMATEIGLIGALLFFWVVYVSYVEPARHAFGRLSLSKTKTALLLAPAMLLGYSLVDFTLNYFIIWLIFWATIGVATQHEA